MGLFPPSEAFERSRSIKGQINRRIVTTTGGGAIILAFVVVPAIDKMATKRATKGERHVIPGLWRTLGAEQ